MSGKGKGLIAVSKLKKRRRPKEGNDGICALPHLPAYSASKQSRLGVHCKENFLNGGLLVVAGKDSILGGNAADGKRGLCPISFGYADASHHSSDDKLKGKSALKGYFKPCRDPKTNQPTISFMDEIENSCLIAAIPSILGIDITRYDASSSDFQRELERAFEYKIERNEHSYLDHQSGIYHTLVGRIGPSSFYDATNEPVSPNDHSIAFPQRRCLSLENTPTKDHQHVVFQHLNLGSKTENGLCIPSSWYQFSKSEIQNPLPLEKISDKCVVAKTVMIKQTAENLTCRDKMHSYDMKLQPSVKSLQPHKITETHIDDKQSLKRFVKKQSSLGSALQIPPRLKYQGKIRIESVKGATIREGFDIDQSNCALGKLNEGDERYFVEKKTLPPAPIPSDDSGGETEDECVAVVRYKIILNRADCVPDVFSEYESGQMVGWISDRGRLADDPYLILREV